MKFSFHLRVLSIVGLSLIFACQSKVERPDPVLTNEQVTQQNAIVEAPIVNSAASGNAGVQHYYCPNACEGSGGDNPGSCPVCGSEYVHNQAYHNTTTNATSTPSSTTTPEPAQNAAGVWHYTCPSGCAGGAGSAVACSSCGATLEHNQAYHN